MNRTKSVREHLIKSLKGCVIIVANKLVEEQRNNHYLPEYRTYYVKPDYEHVQQITKDLTLWCEYNWIPGFDKHEPKDISSKIFTLNHIRKSRIKIRRRLKRKIRAIEEWDFFKEFKQELRKSWIIHRRTITSEIVQLNKTQRMKARRKLARKNRRKKIQKKKQEEYIKRFPPMPITYNRKEQKSFLQTLEEYMKACKDYREKLFWSEYHSFHE